MLTVKALRFRIFFNCLVTGAKTHAVISFIFTDTAPSGVHCVGSSIFSIRGDNKYGLRIAQRLRSKILFIIIYFLVQFLISSPCRSVHQLPFASSHPDRLSAIHSLRSRYCCCLMWRMANLVLPERSYFSKRCWWVLGLDSTRWEILGKRCHTPLGSSNHR